MEKKGRLNADMQFGCKDLISKTFLAVSSPRDKGTGQAIDHYRRRLVDLKYKLDIAKAKGDYRLANNIKLGMSDITRRVAALTKQLDLEEAARIRALSVKQPITPDVEEMLKKEHEVFVRQFPNNEEEFMEQCAMFYGEESLNLFRYDNNIALDIQL